MIRSVATALVGTAVLAALAGCAYQQSFGLPELTPPQGVASGVQVYPGQGYGYGVGSGYGYGYPSVYQPGYGFYDPYYAGQGPYPYDSYRYPYNPYPRYVVVSCADNDGDGRCDGKPPKDRDHQGNDGQGGNHDRDDRPVPPRYARREAPDAGLNTGHRTRRDVAAVVRPQPTPATAPVVRPQSMPAPAPVVKQPARVRPEPRRDASPAQEP
jgi:hypothetical protein